MFSFFFFQQMTANYAKLGRAGILEAHIENFTIKNENFQMKHSGSLHISAQNVDCGYLLEPLGEAVLTSTHNI